jgi:hypothetical protein
MLWAPRSMSSKYVMTTRGSEEYIFEITESEIFWYTIMNPKLYEN